MNAKSRPILPSGALIGLIAGILLIAAGCAGGSPAPESTDARWRHP